MSLAPARKALTVGRWVLGGLLGLALFTVARGLIRTELALPRLHAEAVEAAGSEGTSEQLYARGLDSLGVRLAERQARLNAGEDDVALGRLSAEIESWQVRMRPIIQYRSTRAGLSAFRLASWMALFFLSVFLAALVLTPRYRVRQKARQDSQTRSRTA